MQERRLSSSLPIKGSALGDVQIVAAQRAEACGSGSCPAVITGTDNQSGEKLFFIGDVQQTSEGQESIPVAFEVTLDGLRKFFGAVEKGEFKHIVERSE